MIPTRTPHRTSASWILWVLQFTFAVIHIFPSLTYRVGIQGSTTAVVAYINGLGPIWVILFGVTALGLLFSLTFKKGQYIWHLVSGALFGGYAAALFVGALGDHPHGPVGYPILALLPVVGHILLALSYGGDR